MSELPKGWIWINLNQLVLLLNGDRGKNYPSKSAFCQSGVPFINAGHLVDGKIDDSQMNYISEEHFALLTGGKIQFNDILYCIRGSLGKIALITDSGNGAIASSLVIIRSLENSQPKYIYYFLISPLGKNEIYKYDNGSAQPNLSAANVGSYLIPIPPLNEQRRIVAKLDTVLARTRRAREELEKIQKLCDRYKTALLTSLFNPKSRQSNIKYLSEVGQLFCGQSPSAATVNRDGIGTLYITGPEQWDGETIHQNKWTIDPKRQVPDGCIFITVKGAGVGTLFPGKACAIGRDVYAYLPDDCSILPRYAYFALQYEIKSILLKAKGLIPGLSKEHILDNPIYLPSLEEQKEIVRRVEKLFKSINTTQQETQKALKLCDRLEQATLAKAFRGELVPQDPSDEPASVLLERILAEKQQTAKPPKKSRTKTPQIKQLAIDDIK